MIVVGWMVLGILVLLAVVGVANTVRYGLRGVLRYGCQGLFAALGIFASYTALKGILGEHLFDGYSFLSLSLTLSLPYFIGVTIHWATQRFLRRNH